MSVNTHQTGYYNTDDLMVTARPWAWQQFWNYESSRTLKQLDRQSRFGSFNKLLQFVGTKGTGKTSAARIVGMVACCETLDKTPRNEWSSLALVPCGFCTGCRAVQLAGEGWDRGGYCELNAADSDIGKCIDEVIPKWSRRKVVGSDDLPYVTAIDEAGSLPGGLWKKLHKIAEDTSRMMFILIMRTAEASITLPMDDRIGVKYRFTLPTHTEVVNGLRQVAEIAGLTLDADAADWLAQVNNDLPRASLAALNQVRPYGPNITLPTIQELFPDDTSGNEDLSDDRAEDGLVTV